MSTNWLCMGICRAQHSPCIVCTFYCHYLILGNDVSSRGPSIYRPFLRLDCLQPKSTTEQEIMLKLLLLYAASALGSVFVFNPWRLLDGRWRRRQIRSLETSCTFSGFFLCRSVRLALRVAEVLPGLSKRVSIMGLSRAKGWITIIHDAMYFRPRWQLLICYVSPFFWHKRYGLR